MAGYFRVAFEGEYYNQKIVNVFRYRSNDWLANSGNPFDDVLGVMDEIILELKEKFLLCMQGDYTLENVVGVGYNDAYQIVTASPLIRNLHEKGTYGNNTTNGAPSCAILSLRCGEQHQVSNVGKSTRNRGYLAVGPLDDTAIDSYGHLSDGYAEVLDGLGQRCDNTINSVGAWTSLIPIRIHEKHTTVLGQKVLLWRTYSDVLGYSVRRVASYRRSRQPEA